MDPIPFMGSLEESKKRLLNILETYPGCAVVGNEEERIKAEFRTRIIGFIDDVDFYFDDENKVINFRSASRIGYYDLGLNKRRMKKITKMFLNI